jgi:exportin-1
MTMLSNAVNTVDPFAEANKLLDFNVKLDIGLLDAVVECMNTQTGAAVCSSPCFILSFSTGETQRVAQTLLTRLKEHPDAWTRVDAILQCSPSLATKYYALQILEHVIITRWKVLPRDQCEGASPSFSHFILYLGIRNFVVQLIIDISSDQQRATTQQMYLSKLNLVLVHVVKQVCSFHLFSFTYVNYYHNYAGMAAQLAKFYIGISRRVAHK